MSGESRLDALEIRARELAGGIHARGAIPAKHWRAAASELFLGYRLYDNEPQRVNRIMREVLESQLVKLRAEAREKGWT